MLNEEKLAKMIAEAIKAATGLSPAQLAEQTREGKAADDAAIALQRREAEEKLYATSNAQYLNSVKHLIQSDPHKGLGLKFGRFIRAKAVAKLDGYASAKDVALAWGDRWLADDMDRAEQVGKQKSLAAGAGLAPGGALVPDDYVAEVIELFRAESVVRRAGARQMPMPNGSMTLPRQATASTANYVSELANIPISEPSFDVITLTAKKLTNSVPISNDLLRQSAVAVDALVRDDMAMQMALRQDLAFIRGDGTSNTPRGIRNSILAAHATQIVHAGAVATVAEVNSDLHRIMRLVKAANVPIRRPAWIFSTRIESWLMSLRESGLWYLRDEILQGRLFGVPFFISNQLPENLNVSGSGGNDETEVFFVEMSELLIADTLGMQIDVFPGGAYHDGSTIQSGISTDQTVIRAITEHDCAMRHDVSGAVLTAVDWA